MRPTGTRGSCTGQRGTVLTLGSVARACQRSMIAEANWVLTKAELGRSEGETRWREASLHAMHHP